MRASRPRKSERPIPEGDVDFRRLLRYLLPYWWRMGIALVALMVATGLGLVFPLVIQNVLDTILLLNNTSELDRLTLMLISVFALQSVVRFVEGYQLTLIGEYVFVDIRQDLFDQLMLLPLGFHADRRVGELVSRLSSDTVKLRTVLTSNISTLFSQSLTLIGALGIMVVINWRLMGIIAVFVPIIVGIGAFFGLWMRKISTQRQDAVADSLVVAEEALSGIRVVKSFTREEYEQGRYKHQLHLGYEIARRMALIRHTFGSFMAFIGFSALAAFLWFGGREVLADRLTAGELAAFMLYGATVAGSIASFVGVYTDVQEAIGATKRIFEVIDTPPSVADEPKAAVLPPVKGEITFDSVSFSYDTRIEVLHGINLTIRAGEALALVGSSGAGKSTLFNLIPRFYDPTQGSICFDGVNLRSVTQQSVRAQIGLVPQDTQLFGGTIRENILYGRLTATEEEVIAAAKAANAHDFIMELPDQYQSVVGERGIKLSGGQRQRVAIARALLKDPRILLLDEATSSLDSESEGLVQEALDRLMAGRTTVIIAHRLSTIKAVDRIAVLDSGKIAELGTHEELMAKNGVYAHLYNLQFRERESGVVEGGFLSKVGSLGWGKL